MRDISNEEIMDPAALGHKIDSDTTASPSDMDAFEQGVAHLDAARIIALTIARKLLEEKQYRIISDNPDTIHQCRSLAESIGASVDEICEGPYTQITIRVPER